MSAETLGTHHITKGYNPTFERVGWMQGPHGMTGPVDKAKVVGRELRDVYIAEEGHLRAVVQTYVEATGNDRALLLIPHTIPNLAGYRRNEYEITTDYSLDHALKLKYSPTSRVLNPGEPITLKTNPSPQLDTTPTSLLQEV